MSDSTKKMNEALELLNQAAKEKKSEIKSLLDGRFKDLKDVVSDFTDLGKERLDAAKDWVGEENQKVKDTLKDVDKNVKQNPWPYIAGAAAVTLLLGFIMGSSSKKE